jgi:hypothetical protein
MSRDKKKPDFVRSGRVKMLYYKPKHLISIASYEYSTGSL